MCDSVICGSNGMCVNGECQYPFDSSSCGIHQHLESGTCVCDTGWFGWQCDSACTHCGPHGTCQENWCLCDTGWIGANCAVHIKQFEGRYHVIGTYYSFMGGSTTPPVNIDDTMLVTYNKDTLFARGYAHRLKSYGADTSIYYPFMWMPGSPSNYSLLTFKKAFDDSIFYSSRFGGLGGGTITSLSGKLID